MMLFYQLFYDAECYVMSHIILHLSLLQKATRENRDAPRANKSRRRFLTPFQPSKPGGRLQALMKSSPEALSSRAARHTSFALH